MSDEPRAVIEKQRTGWLIYILDGLIRFGPDAWGGWHRITRKGAERKARRELARYVAKREPERHEIRAAS